MERPSAQQRAKWVERWKDSGLTAKEFAAEAGLKASALYYWCSQLSGAAGKGSAGRDEIPEQSVRPRRTRSARPEKRSATPSPRFVELPVAAVASAPAMLELLLGDVRVRVPSGFDEATLTRVVRALGTSR
jgi:transposase-like protein